jgi:hypothetical protein
MIIAGIASLVLALLMFDATPAFAWGPVTQWRWE